MTRLTQFQQAGAPALVDEYFEHVPQRRPRLPKAWSLKKTGRGIIASVELDEERRHLDSTTEFRVRWAREVDMTTLDGVNAGFSRSIVVGQIAVANSAQCLIADEEKQSGYFFLEAADAAGLVSDPTSPRFIPGEFSGGVPGIVQRWRGTESGVQRDGTVWSLINFACEAPESLGAFWGVQPVFQDYPGLGEISFGEAKQYIGGGGGGSIQGEIILPVGRRTGLGTVTTTAASAVVTFGGAENCLARTKAGDYLEILGVIAQIKSVDSASQVTLGIPAGASVNWPGQIVTALASYDFIAKVRIFARSLSQEQTGEVDLSMLPFFDVVLDGLASVPNSPTLSAAAQATSKISTLGNVIRLFITPVKGVEIKCYYIYRAYGDGVPWPDLSYERIGTVQADHHNPTGLLPYDDTNFTSSEKELNQIFSYRATTVNMRDQQSSESNLVEVRCRIDSGADGSDPPAKMGLMNLIYNGYVSGDDTSSVLANNTAQDTNFITDATNLPGRPFGAASGQAYGTGSFRGHTRWESNDGGTGAAGSNPTFANGNEIHWGSAPGAAKAWYVYEETEAWDTTQTPAFVRLRKDGYITYAVLLARAAGDQPNGILGLYLDLYDNGTFRGECPRRYRDPADDNLKWYTGAAAHIDVSCADLLTDWQLFYGVFKLDSSLGTIRQLRFNLAWFNGTQGGVRACEVMCNHGEERGVFTGEIPVNSWPVPGNPPNAFGDGEGGRSGKFLLPLP